MSSVYPMIMAGGSGTRFWPRSRVKTPKQILNIVSSHDTMIQTAWKLVEDLVPAQNIHIVTSDNLSEQITQQLPNASANQLILEPCGRDTAPCIALAAAKIHQKDPEAIMLMMPSDHVINPHEDFHQAVMKAANIVQKEDCLVTFGIAPTYPATGYGYIQFGELIDDSIGLPLYQVAEFKEKPNEETAKKFIASGQYAWNAGIFVWKAKYILQLINELMPDLAKGLKEIIQSDFQNIQTIYPTLPKISIDFGIMEKAPNVKAIKVAYQWDDVGNWESIINHFQKDDNENLIQGKVIAMDCSNNIIICDNPDQLIATVGLQNMLIVQSGNATLVCPRDKDQEIKKIVAELKQKELHPFL